MKNIGIICALDSEFELIKAALSHGEARAFGRFTVYIAEQDGKRVAAALCGIGKVNAAACAQILISELHVDCIVNSGVAGSLSPALHILDIVIATDAMYHDLIPRLLAGTYFPGTAHFLADERLSVLAVELCAAQSVPCTRGRVVSGDQFVTDSAVKTAITADTDGIAIEMEGAAIGHVCYLNNIPFAIVRCISDSADDSGEMDYDTFVGHAARRCAQITLGLIARA